MRESGLALKDRLAAALKASRADYTEIRLERTGAPP